MCLIDFMNNYSLLNYFKVVISLFLVTISGCKQKSDSVRLITLDPGHFHAALVQKVMLPGVDSTVHVYAPDGADVQMHLNRVEGYNQRTDNPTVWRTIVYTGGDFLERMLSEKIGNVVVLAGNNRNKTEYIRRSIDGGFDVLADKPMVITPDQFRELKESFKQAGEKGLLLYDIMTERYEITSILQRELSMIPEIFGELQKGTIDRPAVVKESVHHFYKKVSGLPLIRPYWFMDVNQQGHGLVDVTTHLVDLVQWTCFPEQVLEFEKDVELISAKRWTTQITRNQFKKVTGLAKFPQELNSVRSNDSTVAVYSNGSINYLLRGVNVSVKVEWALEAGEGRGDTHYSHLIGTHSKLVIRQGEEQNFKPVLYIEPENILTEAAIKSGFEAIRKKFPGVELRKKDGIFEVVIPAAYHNGHEAHFAQVLQKFLEYRERGSLPDWETAGMLTKYKLLMEALKKAK